MRRSFLALVACLLTGLSAPATAQAPKPTVTVFAAASLTDALNALGEQYTKETGAPVRFSFASSSVVARQIEAGAPADIFVSADGEWMDYLQARQLIRVPSRRNILSNKLVLIAPKDAAVTLTIARGFPLAQALRGGRLSVGDPDTVPAGKYARQALTSLGVWNDVADRLARAENVRAALLYVSRGETPLGIVYETDAKIDPGVKIVGTFPASSHLPIIYPAALTTKANAAAPGFLDYMRGPQGKAVFARFGFSNL